MEEGNILYVDNDLDDQFLFRRAISEIGCKRIVKCFSDGIVLLEYLRQTDKKPFIIICDFNIPIANGLQLRHTMTGLESLRIKSIPFILFAKVIKPKDVDNAYLDLVQGFFRKPRDFQEYKTLLNGIIFYWSKAISPGLSTWESFQ